MTIDNMTSYQIAIRGRMSAYCTHAGSPDEAMQNATGIVKEMGYKGRVKIELFTMRESGAAFIPAFPALALARTVTIPAQK